MHLETSLQVNSSFIKTDNYNKKRNVETGNENNITSQVVSRLLRQEHVFKFGAQKFEGLRITCTHLEYNEIGNCATKHCMPGRRICSQLCMVFACEMNF